MLGGKHPSRHWPEVKTGIRATTDPPTAAGCAALRHLRLKPGVGACLRRLRGVVVAIVQARWALWIRQNNASLAADREPVLRDRVVPYQHGREEEGQARQRHGKDKPRQKEEADGALVEGDEAGNAFLGDFEDGEGDGLAVLLGEGFAGAEEEALEDTLRQLGVADLLEHAA